MIYSGGREPLLIQDTSKHPVTCKLKITKDVNIGSYLGVPIILSDGTMFGTLCAIDPQPDTFNESDIEKMTTFASFIANSINLSEAYKTIRKQDERIIHELEVAKSVQVSVLSEPLKNNHISISSLYESSEHLSGDMYCWYRIDDKRYGIFLFDVMGHGVSSALISMSVRSLLKDLITMITDPVVVIEKINQHVIHLFRERAELITYLTAFYMVIDVGKQTIEYVNAGHPTPLVFSENGSTVELSEGTVPLGIMKEISIQKVTIPFTKNTDIVLYTDGIFEILPSSQLKSSQKIDRLYLDSGRSLDQLKENIDIYIKKHNTLPDDICLIFIEL